MKLKHIALGIIPLLAIGIGVGMYLHAGNTKTATKENAMKMQPIGPDFNADSAYLFTKAQCDFGPRIMNSEAHERCAEWIIDKFKQYGCSVKTQKMNLNGYDGTLLKCTNIMASYNPQATTRILLCAHWDARPWADNDPDTTNRRRPILAANDGASGVAVMLELARVLQGDKRLNIGSDFVCFDAEDWGTPRWSNQPDDESTWALGAQFWAANLPRGYQARYGILLDMVGGQGARFFQESASRIFAPIIVDKVWLAAEAIGYGSYFPKQEGGMITDDHVPINKTAKIPTIDIIPFYPDCAQSTFGPTWHTVNDNMDNIDKNTLKAVGQVMVQVLYSETK